MSSRFLREDGVEISREIIKEAFHIFNRVLDEVYRTIIYERLKHGRIITFAPLIFESLEKELQNIKADDSYINDMQKALKAMTNHCRFHEGDELERITWEKHEQEYNIPEGGDVHIPGGYAQIINHLMKLIPKKSLMLKKEVVEILRSDEIIEIKTRDGSTFEADHVIVTSSIGYLKKHHETLFKPKLPQSKIDVLTSLELGRVNKIFLEFDQPILAPTYHSIAFAWDDTSIKNVQNDWYKRIFGFDQIFTKNNTLLGWIAGDAAEYMETLSNDEIGKICTELLRKFLGNRNIPNPKAVLVSRWCNNPYVLGSYFHQSKRMIPGEQMILSEPITTPSGGPVIMFAGEALTNGCTHGARDSGIQQAERLIDLYMNKNIDAKL
jgi:monoamine oxidase